MTALCFRVALAILASLSLISCTEDDDMADRDDATGSSDRRGAAGSTSTSSRDSARCTSPEGWSVSYPSGWVAKSLDGAGCSQFHPEEFTIEPNTDLRVAAITIYADAVPFEVATEPSPGRRRDVETRELTIDGHDAVRTSYTEAGEGLYPEGTPITRYAIDLSGGRGDSASAETLFLDTVGLRGFDYERNVAVLDGMASSIEIR